MGGDQCSGGGGLRIFLMGGDRSPWGGQGHDGGGPPHPPPLGPTLPMFTQCSHLCPHHVHTYVHTMFTPMFTLCSILTPILHHVHSYVYTMFTPMFTPCSHMCLHRVHIYVYTMSTPMFTPCAHLCLKKRWGKPFSRLRPPKGALFP